MAKKKVELSEVNKSHLKIIGYLTVSGGLGYLISTAFTGNSALTAIFAPAVNYILWIIEKELKKEGYITKLKE